MIAVQFDDRDRGNDICGFLNRGNRPEVESFTWFNGFVVMVHNHGEKKSAGIGDWIIQDDNGLRVMTNSAFREAYDFEQIRHYDLLIVEPKAKTGIEGHCSRKAWLKFRLNKPELAKETVDWINGNCAWVTAFELDGYVRYINPADSAELAIPFGYYMVADNGLVVCSPEELIEKYDVRQ